MSHIHYIIRITIVGVDADRPCLGGFRGAPAPSLQRTMLLLQRPSCYCSAPESESVELRFFSSTGSILLQFILSLDLRLGSLLQCFTRQNSASTLILTVAWAEVAGTEPSQRGPLFGVQSTWDAPLCLAVAFFLRLHCSIHQDQQVGDTELKDILSTLIVLIMSCDRHERHLEVIVFVIFYCDLDGILKQVR